MLVGCIAACAISCGYRPLRAGLAGHPRIRVAPSIVRVAAGVGASVGEQAEIGARAELARFGALASVDDQGADELTLEIARVDDRSAGAFVGGDGVAHARGLSVRVTMRGLVRGPDGAFETADVDETEIVAAPLDATAWMGARDVSARGSARRAGARVAREVLGLP